MASNGLETAFIPYYNQIMQILETDKKLRKTGKGEHNYSTAPHQTRSKHEHVLEHHVLFWMKYLEPEVNDSHGFLMELNITRLNKKQIK